MRWGEGGEGKGREGGGVRVGDGEKRDIGWREEKGGDEGGRGGEMKKL